MSIDLSNSTREVAGGFITEQLEQATDHADKAQEALTSFMETLDNSSTNLSNIPFSDVTLDDIGDLPHSTAIAPPVFTGDVSVGDFDVSLAEYIPIVLPDMPDMPVAPIVDTPNPELLFFESEYISSVLSSLESVLATNLAGGTGLSAEVEQAIYDRDAVRRDLASDQQLQEIQYAFTGRGFDLPSGAFVSALQQEMQSRTLAHQEASRDVMIKAADLEQKNMEIAVQYSVQLQSLLLDSHDKVQERALKKAESTLQHTFDLWLGSLDRYKNLLEAAKIEADVSIAYVDGTASANKAIADANAARVSAARLSLDGDIAVIDATIKQFEASISGYSAYMRKYEAEANAASSEFTAQARHAEAKATIELKQSEAHIQAIIAVRSLLLEAAKTGASVSAQSLASALNSVNAAVSYGYSANSSYSTVDSYDKTKTTPSGETTQNIHNFDETSA